MKTFKKCKKRSVVAIIKNKKGDILSIGNNIPIIGNKECCRRIDFKPGSCPSECNAVHAEVMAIINAKQDLSGSTIYITYSPCINCARIIAASGIKHVISYYNYYEINSIEDKEVKKIFKNYGITFKLEM